MKNKNISSNYVDLDLEQFAKNNKDKFNKNNPYPHVLINNLFKTNILKSIITDFPSHFDKNAKQYASKWGSQKSQSVGEIGLNDKTVQFLHYLNSQPFLKFLEDITGIKKLLPDPTFYGGGLHQIKKNGHLKIHADFIRHPHYNLYRRLNLIVFLNENWKDAWGGNLELWDKQMKNPEVVIKPNFNTSVIFNTTSYSFHGHPNPLNCPEEIVRKSIALYYYTIEKPPINDLIYGGDHGTLYQNRPGLDNFSHEFSYKRIIAKYSIIRKLFEYLGVKIAKQNELR